MHDFPFHLCILPSSNNRSLSHIIFPWDLSLFYSSRLWNINYHNEAPLIFFSHHAHIISSAVSIYLILKCVKNEPNLMNISCSFIHNHRYHHAIVNGAVPFTDLLMRNMHIFLSEFMLIFLKIFFRSVGIFLISQFKNSKIIKISHFNIKPR